MSIRTVRSPTLARGLFGRFARKAHFTRLTADVHVNLDYPWFIAISGSKTIKETRYIEGSRPKERHQTNEGSQTESIKGRGSQKPKSFSDHRLGREPGHLVLPNKST
jgi:hypothetical protein